ncbi:MAG: hypothetical protein ACK5LJ_07975 [Paracoccus sp. (in: a-proteobacteria)]
MRLLTVVILAMAAMAGEVAGQEFYAQPDEMPTSGREVDFINACWNGLKTEMEDRLYGTEAIMVPQFKPLTAQRMGRYGGVSFADGMEYADTTFIIWTADAVGVEFPLAIRCEAPINPAAPDFSRVFLTEDPSLNPNIPPEERPPRD